MAISIELNKLLKKYYNVIEQMASLDISFLYKDTIKGEMKECIGKISKYYDEYNENYITHIVDNNEIYEFFKTDKLKTINESEERNLLILKNASQKTLLQITQELEEKQRLAVQRYREVDQKYIPKTSFIAENKKANKQAYIETSIQINEQRVANEKRYDEKIDSLGYQNEQVQSRLSHDIERISEHYNEEIVRLTKQYEIDLAEIEARRKAFEDEYSQLISKHLLTIHTNTIELNNTISGISESFNQGRTYGLVPYNIEEERLRQESAEVDKTYSMIEEEILNNFRDSLLENDKKIAELREEHRNTLAQFDKMADDYKKEHQKRLTLIETYYDTEIKKYTPANSAYYKKLLLHLRFGRKEQIKNENELFVDLQRELANLRMQENVDFKKNLIILQAEKDRIEKKRYYAIVNLHNEKDIQKALLDNERKLNSSLADSFKRIDENKEAIEVNGQRVDTETLTAKENYEISILQRKIRYNNFLEEGHKQKLLAKFNYDKELALFELNYQKNIYNLRINRENALFMLESQRLRTISSYDSKKYYEQMEFEKKKIDFYNECDNIQYELYRLEHDYLNKRLDEEMRDNERVLAINQQFLSVKEPIEQRVEINKSQYNKNLARVNLYRQRFENEKILLSEANELFLNCVAEITQCETTLLNTLQGASEEVYKRLLQPVVTGVEIIRLIKVNLLEDYYNNEFRVIDTRINFEKDVKNNGALEVIRTEKNAYYQQANARKSKLEETINNYKKGIVIFKQKLAETVSLLKEKSQELDKLKNGRYFNQNFKIELSELQTAIDSLKARRQAYINQITVTEASIKELEASLLKIKKEVYLAEKRFASQFEKIHQSQKLESKIFYDTISIIRKQYIGILNKTNSIGEFINPTKLTYKKVSNYIAKAHVISAQISTLARDYYKYHSTFLSDEVQLQLKELEDSYHHNFVKTDTNIYQSLLAEENSKRIKLQANEQLFYSTLGAIEEEYEANKNMTLQRLRQLNHEQELAQQKHFSDLLSFEKELEYILSCQENNKKMYNDIYQEETLKVNQSYKKNKENSLVKLNELLMAQNEALKDYTKNDINQKQINLEKLKNALINVKQDNITKRRQHKESIKKIMVEKKVSIVASERITKTIKVNYFSKQHQIRLQLVAALKEIDKDYKLEVRKQIVQTLKDKK